MKLRRYKSKNKIILKRWEIMDTKQWYRWKINFSGTWITMVIARYLFSFSSFIFLYKKDIYICSSVLLTSFEIKKVLEILKTLLSETNGLHKNENFGQVLLNQLGTADALFTQWIKKSLKKKWKENKPVANLSCTISFLPLSSLHALHKT